MARPKTIAATYQAVTIRIPQEIMTLCQERAAAEDRSLNWEIVRILREWYVHQHNTPLVPHRRSPFDSAKFYLGVLCEQGHVYGATGQSLRSLKDKVCRACVLAEKRKGGVHAHQRGGNPSPA